MCEMESGKQEHLPASAKSTVRHSVSRTLRLRRCYGGELYYFEFNVKNVFAD